MARGGRPRGATLEKWLFNQDSVGGSAGSATGCAEASRCTCSVNSNQSHPWISELLIFNHNRGRLGQRVVTRPYSFCCWPAGLLDWELVGTPSRLSGAGSVWESSSCSDRTSLSASALRRSWASCSARGSWSPDGREQVLDGDTGQPVLDPRCAGAYHYTTPKEGDCLRQVKHMVQDVVSSDAFGGNGRRKG